MNGIVAAFRDLDDARHRAEFYRLWSAGHSAGFAHPKSFETMGPRESAPTENVRRRLLSGTRGGRDVASLMSVAGGGFDEFERALLTLGDESGQLDQALHLLAEFHEKKHRLMLWVKKQLAYPLFTALAICFILPFPLLFFGHTLAYLVSAFSGVALLLFGSQSAIAAVAASYGRRPSLARARMARGLATAVQAGLPLPRAVRLAGDASGNPAIRAFIGEIGEHRLATTSMRESLARCPHLTPDFISVLATAEVTGDFSPLTRLAELYEDGFRG